MNQGRDKWAWGFVSSILAQLYNSNLMSDSKQATPPDFNPYGAALKERMKKNRLTTDNFDFMRAFCVEKE